MQEKFCLIGRDISHSKSKDVYKKLLKREVSYDLLDFENEDKIPSLSEIFNKYTYISITAPYKRFFYDKVFNVDLPGEIHAINTLRKNDSFYDSSYSSSHNFCFEGTNTDYLASLEILSDFKREKRDFKVCILGSGVMKEVISFACQNLGFEFEVFSRKNCKDLEYYDFDAYFKDKKYEKRQGLLVINTCSRNFIFKGQVPKESIFWDLNYLSLPFKKEGVRYLDGFSLLEGQAKFALKFWKLL